MTMREALAQGCAVLEASTFHTVSESARLDASLLLAHCLGISRSRLYAALRSEIDEATMERFRNLIAARATGRPVAYLLGRKEFYGRDFSVDEHVLIPRPDTEILVEVALDSDGNRPFVERGSAFCVHELCTGSGAVAISLAAERPDWELSASDISERAIAMARRNSLAILGREIPFYCGDLFSALDTPMEGGASSSAAEAMRQGRGEDAAGAGRPAGTGGFAGAGARFDLILANPPYVPSAETEELLSLGWGEPRLALDGGKDGFDLYRRIVPEALHHLSPGGLLWVESDSGQAPALRRMLSESGYTDIRSVDDLAGHERVTGGRRPCKT
jgi:release factor glutamine methyltransferase